MGGSRSKLPIEFPEEYVPVQSINDVVVILEKTLNEVRQGKRDVKRANCIGYLCNLITDALKVRDIETKISMFERVILSKRE